MATKTSGELANMMNKLVDDMEHSAHEIIEEQEIMMHNLVNESMVKHTEKIISTMRTAIKEANFIDAMNFAMKRADRAEKNMLLVLIAEAFPCNAKIALGSLDISALGIAFGVVSFK
jgi:hypothetical protein